MNVKIDERVRIRLESFNHELLGSSCRKIITNLKEVSSHTIRSIPLPTRKKIYCVLRSPHVDKDSREHFEIRIHRRILDIHYNKKVDIFDHLSQMNLPSGVACKILVNLD